MNYNITPSKLARLAQLALEISHQAADASAFNMSDKQRRALDRVLRILDIRNEYEAGDMLRKAFDVEMDGLRCRPRKEEL